VSLNPQLTRASASAMAEALSALLNNGYLRIYTGPQPADADTALTTQVLLAELRFNADFAPAAVDGVLTANAIVADPAANASGFAEWARLLAADGATVVMDGTVDTIDANIILTTTDIVAGSNVPVSSLVISMPLAGEVLAPDAG
jgi:hypothetical protein